MAKQSKNNQKSSEPKPILDAKTPQLEEANLLPLNPLARLADPGDAIQAYAGRLSDQRYPKIQRQQLASQIGEQLGNQYLQRVMRSVDEQRQGTPAQKAEVQIESSRPTSNLTISGNRIQLVQQMPLSVRIPTVARTVNEEEEQGETLRIPIMRPSKQPEGMDENILTDAVRGAITIRSSMRQGVRVGSLFGFSQGESELHDIEVNRVGDAFEVTAVLHWTAVWDVQPSRGPQGQVDIEGPEDPDITADNYRQVARDLTPDMSREGGTPPRTQFWSRDLTIIHEQFHAREYRDFGIQAMETTNDWLNLQTASSPQAVRALLPTALDIFVAVIDSCMEKPASEIRAYSDGAPAYRARTQAIRERGRRGQY